VPSLRRRGRRTGGVTAAAAAAEAELEELAGAASAAAATEEEAPLPAPAAAPDPAAAAFFDVDGTLMRGASIFYFARGLSARGYFSTRDVLSFISKQARFRLSGKEAGPAELAEMREAALAFVAGRDVATIVALGEEIWVETMAEKVYAATARRAQEHLAAGQRVWLVTATPVELARVIGRELGLTGALGTVAEVTDGTYTGRLVGVPLHGPAKAEAVRALAAAEGLDLARCAAYSDSANDIPMLSAVGHPCAVNPDPDLKAHAREQGWEVLDLRTGRRAVKIAIPAAAGTGALAGAAIAGVVLRRRHHDRSRLRAALDALTAVLPSPARG